MSPGWAVLLGGCQPALCPACHSYSGAGRLVVPWGVPFRPPGHWCHPLGGTRVGEGSDSWDTELVQCLLLQFWDFVLNLGLEPLFQQLSLWLL